MAFGSGTESLVFIDDNDMTTLCSDSAVAVKLITLTSQWKWKAYCESNPRQNSYISFNGEVIRAYLSEPSMSLNTNPIISN